MFVLCTVAVGARKSAVPPTVAVAYGAFPTNFRGRSMAQEISPAREAIRGTAPKLAEISDTLIYGEVWERPQLSKRDRSLIVVAALIAMGREQQLEGHLERALRNGVTKEELSEI